MKAIAVGVGAVLAVLLTTSAAAQTQRPAGGTSAGGAQLQALQQQLQQTNAERAALQAENTQLEKELELARAEAARLRGERAGLQQKAQAADSSLRELTANNDTTSQSLARLREQQEELLGRFRQTVQTLANVEGDRNQVRVDLAARERELNSCVDTNLTLHQLNVEILTRLEDRGLFSTAAGREPFTRLTRTRLENLIDDARYRAAALKLAPAATDRKTQ